MSIYETGVPSMEQVRKVSPSEARRRKGPVAVIECFQRIPCDPCTKSCPRGAIKPLADINDIPEMDFDKCTGCGICVASCPGLAIFVVDESPADGTCRIAMPYEFSPIPSVGERVTLYDREGQEVGVGEVERVVPGKKPSGTTVVWVRCPAELSLVARHLSPAKGECNRE